MAVELGELAVEIVVAGADAAAAAIAGLTAPSDLAVASLGALDAATLGLDAVLAGLSAQVGATELELAGIGSAAAASQSGFGAASAGAAGTDAALSALEGVVGATRAALAGIGASGGVAGSGLAGVAVGAETAVAGAAGLDAALVALDAALAGTDGTIAGVRAALVSAAAAAGESVAGFEAAGVGAADAAVGIGALGPIAEALAPQMAVLRAAIAETQVALGVTTPVAGAAGVALAGVGPMAASSATGVTAASGAVAELDGALAVLAAAIAPTEAALDTLLVAVAASADGATAAADGMADAAVGVGALDAAAAALAATLAPLAGAVGETRAAIAGVTQSTAAASGGIHVVAAAATTAVPPVDALAGAALRTNATLMATGPAAAAASSGLAQVAAAAAQTSGALSSLDAFMAAFVASSEVTTSGAEAMAAGIAACGGPLDEVAIGMSAAGQAAAVAAAGFESVAAGADLAATALEAFDAALAATEAYFAPLIAALLPLIAAMGMFETIKHAITDSADLEQSQERLKLAVENTGASWDTAGAQMSASIQHVVSTTTVGVTEATDALQRLVLFTGDATLAENNLAFAVNLSKASKKDLDTTTRALGAALEGNTNLLQRQFPSLRGNADILNVLRHTTASYAADELNHLGGQLDMVGKSFTVLLTAIGDAIAQGDGFKGILKSLSDGLQDAAKWVNENHAAFALLGDVIMSVVKPAWALLAGTVRILVSVFETLKPVLLRVGEAINLAFNSAVIVIGGVIAVLGGMLVLLDKGLHGLAFFSADAAALAQTLDGVGQAAVTMGENIATNAVKSMHDITQELAEMAVAKAKLEGTTAAAPAAVSPNDAMVSSMREQLALGKELAADDETQAQGVAILNKVLTEAQQLLHSSTANSQQKAAALKIEHEAIDAIISPMKEQLDVGKALIDTDGHRAEGLAIVARVEADAQRIASLHGATLKEKVAALTLAKDAESAMLEPMRLDLALGTDLVENARTEAQGVALLTQVEVEAQRVIESHTAKLSEKAEAYKTLKAAQDALLKPIQDEIALGKDLLAEEDTRAMGVARLSDAEGAALRVIAENADKPALLAKGYQDLRAAQEASLAAVGRDVSDGAVLIASTQSRAVAVDLLNRAEQEATFVLHDKSATLEQVAKAEHDLSAIELARLVPLTQEVAAAREMAAAGASHTAVLHALAQAEADVEAKLATLTPGTDAYKVAQRDLTEVISATIMALEGQAKEDEKGALTGSQRSATLAKLALDEVALKTALQQTNLTLEERKTLLSALKGVEEAQGDFSMQAAEQVKQDLKSAQETVQKDINSFGVNTGMALNTALDAGMKAAFSGKDPMKAMGTAMLSSMGTIFSQMGDAMVKQGIIMMGMDAAVADPITSGPASIAVGLLLSALGATLGGIMQGGGSGSSSGAAATGTQTINTTYFQTGAGGEASGVTPAGPGPNITVIGPNDPEAQRQIGKMMRNIAGRGIQTS
jgi:hypothetical protein